MKICLLTETYHPVVGGGETQARLLAEGLSARGDAVCMITRRSDASLASIEKIGPVTVYRAAPVGQGQLKKWGLIFSTGPLLWRLRRDYDLIFVSGFRIMGVVAVIAARLLGKRVVLKADSQGEMSGDFFAAGLARQGLDRSSLAFRIFMRLRNLILRRADAFVAITPDVAAELAAANIPQDRVHMIPNGVDAGRFHPAGVEEKRELRARLGLENATNVAVYTGRLVSYKGLPLLLRAWRAILHRHAGAKLLLVGTGGLDIDNCEDELRGYVRDNGLADSVIFTGSVTNVPDYLRASDIFVFPTENDAFPSSLVEAMTCGLPVIATPVGAIKVIVEDGRNGLIVPPGNLDALRSAVERLLNDASLARQIGAVARTTATARYSAELVTERYRQLFADIQRAGKQGRRDDASRRRLDAG